MIIYKYVYTQYKQTHTEMRLAFAARGPWKRFTHLGMSVMTTTGPQRLNALYTYIICVCICVYIYIYTYAYIHIYVYV